MSSYMNEKYDLKIKSLYELFSNYKKEEIDLALKTFKNAYSSINLLRKKYGRNLDGVGVASFMKLSFMEESSLINFLSRVDTRIKCVSYLLSQNETAEQIEELFKSKDDNEINTVIRNIMIRMGSIKPQEEESIFETKEQILEKFNIDEDSLIEAISLVDDQDKRLSYQYTYGISSDILSKKDICKKLGISKLKYEKYIKEVQKNISRLLEKAKNRKAFKERKLKEEQEEKAKSNITTEKPQEKIEDKEIISTKIIEPILVEDKKIEVDEEPTEIIPETIIEESEEKEEIQTEVMVEEKVEEKTEAIEESKLDISTTEVKENPLSGNEDKEISKSNDEYDDMLVSLYVDDIGLEDIEVSTINPFKKAVLIIAYYDKNNNKRIANLYIQYLQERYKNNIEYLTILNKLMMIINKIGNSFDIDNYEKIFEVKEQDNVKEVVKEKVEVIEDVIDSVICDEPQKADIIEVTDKEEAKEELIDTKEEEESKQITKEIKVEEPVAIKQDNLVIYEKSLKEKTKLEKKKHVKTIREVLYDDIIVVEKELYVLMSDSKHQHQAVKAWDILEDLTCRSFDDKEALEKVINLLRRLDDDLAPQHVKGLVFPSNYEKVKK